MHTTETTVYYMFDNGSVASRTVTGSEPPALPDGAVEITQAEYEQELAAIQQAHDDAVADVEAAEAQQREDDYNALIAAGIPEATARRMAGYYGDESPGDLQ